MCFVFTGGLRESRMVDFETGTPHFPDDYPDSPITSQLEISEAVELTIKHHKYPPNKRPNYDKLNTNSPFRCVLVVNIKMHVFGAWFLYCNNISDDGKNSHRVSKPCHSFILDPKFIKIHKSIPS